jgi:glucose/arabinose dehydrogenase
MRSFVFIAMLIFPAVAGAANLRAGFVETPIASGLATPTAMAFAPDGRLFVCQQGGRLRVIKNGALLAVPFLTVTVSAAGERGLLGIAFDPAFESNQFVYIYYTATTPTVHNRVSRFTANGDVAVAGSETVLLDLPALSATNHNGGAIHFGPDGLLYIGVGENAVESNAQSLASPLGKILRINADGTIPGSNPFISQTNGINRAIWALGLRNPYTFVIEPLSSRMLINDVGQDAWEEINEGIAGANYGWPDTEGPTGDGRFTSPIFAYTHDASGGCAISGAALYPTLAAPYPAEYQGDYFFADFCGGWIRQLDLATNTNQGDFASGIPAPVDLAVGPDGSLYYLARGSGSTTGVVMRIDFAGASNNRPPVATIRSPAAGALYVAGSTISFSGSATDPEDGALPGASFTWEIVFHHGAQADAFLGPISGSTAGTFRIPDTGDPSADVFFRIHLTVVDSNGRATTTFRDIKPRVMRVTLLTRPAGLLVSLDGQAFTAPHTFDTVAGMRRTIAAVSPQERNGITYAFGSWSDRGGAKHEIVPSTRNTRFTVK